MANSISHARLPYPIRKARFTILVPYLDADGDPTDPTTPDTEFSTDAGAFGDCAEEVTTISGSNGMGYITLTGAEMDGSMVAVAAKVASGPKNTLATLYPRDLPILVSGTATAGASGSITLASAPTYDITGCFIRTTGGTGGGGTGGANNQARRISSYDTGTGVASVSPNWETTPDNTTTYDVLLPEGVTPGMIKALNPATAGRTLVVSSGGAADAQVKGIDASAITATSIAPDAITAAKIAADAIGASELAADAVTEIVTGLLATALTEAYASPGATATIPQLLYMVWAALANMAVVGNTITVYGLDGTTARMTFTTDDPTNPTLRDRTT